MFVCVWNRMRQPHSETYVCYHRSKTRNVCETIGITSGRQYGIWWDACVAFEQRLCLLWSNLYSIRIEIRLCICVFQFISVWSRPRAISEWHFVGPATFVKLKHDYHIQTHNIGQTTQAQTAIRMARTWPNSGRTTNAVATHTHIHSTY